MFNFKKNAKGLVLFDKICEKIEVAEKDYFGLRYIDEKDGQVLYMVFLFVCFFFLTLLLLGMSQKKFLITVSLHFHTDR